MKKKSSQKTRFLGDSEHMREFFPLLDHTKFHVVCLDFIRCDGKNVETSCECELMHQLSNDLAFD